MNSRPNKVIVGLDVGTTKVCSLVAICHSPTEIKITGIGSHPSHGLKKGTVVNMEKTIRSIQCSLEEARVMSGLSFTKVNLGISGGHIFSFNSVGVVAVKNQEVTLLDISRALEAARAIIIPDDREILHLIPQEYKVDSLSGIRDPLGMRGNRLEVKAHVVTGANSLIKNLVNCVEQAGYGVDQIILQPLCSSEAVLSAEEKEVGVALVDIGGGTTDVAIWKGGALIHSEVIPVGGNHFTNDLSVALKIPHAEAEKIKVEYGSVIPGKLNSQAHISLQGLSGSRPRETKLVHIAEVLEARAEELLETVNQIVLDKNLKDQIGGGFVFTGGGALIKSLPELAEYILERPTKIGFPLPFGGMTNSMQNPKYSTVLGLILENHRRHQFSKNDFHTTDTGKSDFIKKFTESLRSVFREIF